MKTISKALVGTVAAGAMAMTSASPAFARDHRDKDRIDAGDIIAGAVIIGGIAAIASAVGKKDRYRDRGYRGHRGDYYRGGHYDDRRGYRRGNPRRAIEKCVRAVEADARRAGYRFADVTEIRDVDRERRGWEIDGRLVVDGARGYGRYRTNYSRYDRYDRRGYNGYARGNDRGKFSCEIRRGRVVDIDYSGIRGLR